MAANIKNFVIDASVVLAVLLPDERVSPNARRLLKIIISRENRFFAPKLLEFEAGNGLKSAVLGKRIRYESLEKLLNNFEKIPITFTDINMGGVMKLAVEREISFYDASYLYLAKLKKCKLLTLDSCLEKMAEKEVRKLQKK